MPLFAFLSGILYREKYNVSIKQVCVYTRKKIEGCYVPFVMYNLIFMVLHNFFYKIHIYGELSNGIYYRLEDYLRKTISILTMGGGESIPGPMWYLIAMLEFTVLYAVIRYGTQKYVRNNKICNVLITFICLIFMLVGFSKFDLPRMLNRALVLVFYYHLGYMAHTYWDFQTIGYEYRKKKYATALCSIGILIIGMCMGGDWPTFSWCIVPSGIAGITLVLNISCWVNKELFKLKQFLAWIGQHTIFILGTQYLCFKLGNLLQIICQGKDITWLEMYGVRVEEFWLWKIVYFLCGIGIPLIIIKIKDEIYKFCGDKNKKC